MSDEMSIDLAAFGWSERLAREFGMRFTPELEAARVVGTAKGSYLLRSVSREGWGRTTGAFAHRAGGPQGLPAIGDWTAVRSSGDPSVPFLIEGLLARSSAVSRKQPEEQTQEQILAANVDVGCIVFSLEGGRKCSPRAAERYATTVWSSGALPLVVLNKSDLAETLDDSVAEIAAVVPGVQVLATSCLTGEGIEDLRAHLPAGKTAVLLGPSGVGKSMLINVLTGSERQAVGEVRRGDLKGRHTTSSRKLIVVSHGALIIDTPGLRELQLWAEEADLDASFPEVAALADGCRFRDCTHTGEPGCAVQAALAEGVLPHDRFASFLELKRELAYLERRTDERLRREHRDRWKAIGREMRSFSKESRSRGA